MATLELDFGELDKLRDAVRCVEVFLDLLGSQEENEHSDHKNLFCEMLVTPHIQKLHEVEDTLQKAFEKAPKAEEPKRSNRRRK